MTIIALKNESTVLTDDQVQAAVPALHKQIVCDFAEWWTQGRGVGLVLLKPGDVVPPGAWIAHLLDNSDQAGALGYHDLTATDQPESLIFVKSDIDAGASWTVTISHELLEMLVDPLASISVMNGAGTKFYGLEVCDACEDDSFGYEIDGVLVSDFVTPLWFEDNRPAGSAQFDFKQHITAPFGLISGGYVGFLDLSNLAAGWQQATAERAPARQSQRFARRAAKFGTSTVG